jgi:GT2 family glycosyltransferase
MQKSPQVSVLMPVHNGEAYLSPAIDSILGQTFRDFEFIIVDDGSSDRSRDIIRDYARVDARIRPFYCEHRGITVVLNQGVTAARGEFIARMDADDISLPERLAVQLRFLDENPSVVAVGCALDVIDPDGDSISVMRWPIEHEEIDRRLLIGQGGLPHPAAMIRRQALLAVGGYREQYQVAQDKDLWLRLAEHGRLANLPTPLLRYRQHLRSISSVRQREQRLAVARAIEEACRRRGQEVPAAVAMLAQSPPAHAIDMRRVWSREAMRHGHYRTACKHLCSYILEKPYSPLRWGRAFLYSLGALRNLRRLIMPRRSRV